MREGSDMKLRQRTDDAGAEQGRQQRIRNVDKGKRIRPRTKIPTTTIGCKILMLNYVLTQERGVEVDILDDTERFLMLRASLSSDDGGPSSNDCTSNVMVIWG